MPKLATYILALPTVVIIAVLATTGPGAQTARGEKKKTSNLDFWLSQATTSPASRPADKPTDHAENPLSSKNQPPRPDAVPGVIEMSNGTQAPGWLYTTRDKPWVVFDPNTDRWRQIPFITVLSINAVVTEEKYVLQWRWKAMGVPEKVFTGRKFPFDDRLGQWARCGRKFFASSARGRHSRWCQDHRSCQRRVGLGGGDCSRGVAG